MRLSSSLRPAAAIASLFLATSPSARGYVLEGPQWAAGTKITIQLQLGASGVPLIDGAASWSASAEDALGIWNSVLGSVQFNVVRDSAIPIVQGDGKNSVFFSDTAFGTAFASGILGLTLYEYNISPAGVQTFTEADVVFNSAAPFNSYRGALHNFTGSLMYDFHRTALHEFGHLLGITHTPQDAQAIMTPVSTNIDVVQADDIAGVQSLYGAPTGTTPASTPAPVPVIPTVGVAASAPFADFDEGAAARVVITRTSDDLSQDLKVLYSVSGSAVPGLDYAALGGAKKIKAGSSSATLTIKALRHTGGRKIKLTILSSNDYEPGVYKVKLKIQ